MNEVFPKFIIETDSELGDCLIVSKCTYHKELVCNSKMVKGGGWWELDREKKIFTLYGESHDYGEAQLDDIIRCVKNKKTFSSSALYNCLSKTFTFKYRKSDGEIINLE